MYSATQDDDDMFAQIQMVDQQEPKSKQIPKSIEKKDLMVSFDIKERRYQEEAKVSIKKNSILASALTSSHTQVRTRIVSDFKNMNAVTSKLMKEHQLNQA